MLISTNFEPKKGKQAITTVNLYKTNQYDSKDRMARIFSSLYKR
jgi:hypothetical protein